MRRDHLVPVLVGLLVSRDDLARVARASDARVVDQYVDSAERRDEVGKHLCDRSAIRDVRDEWSSLATGALDFGHDVARGFWPDVINADFRALARERQSHLASESRAAASDQHHFVLELHRDLIISCLP